MSETPATSGALRPDRELLRAWLLLFLARGSGYGYGMAEQLREQALVCEMTVTYRVLRALEEEEQVSSRWIDSTTGPRRRLYSLTSTGRRTLDLLVSDIMQQRHRYDEFLRVYERPGRRANEVGDVAASLAARNGAAGHAHRELLGGWLLLLLEGDASYGYDLRRHLAEHEVKADPGLLYRLLRRMDADGMLRSRWSDPILGPQRRVYRLTAKGRARLAAVADLIGRTRDVHDAFVRAYADVDDDCRGPAAPLRHAPAPASEPGS